MFLLMKIKVQRNKFIEEIAVNMDSNDVSNKYSCDWCSLYFEVLILILREKTDKLEGVGPQQSTNCNGKGLDIRQYI